MKAPDLVLHSGRITTLDPQQSEAQAIAIADWQVLQTGSDDEILALAPPQAQKIDLKNRRVIPSLNDSHLHVIRAGLFFNLELRWDGVPTIAQAMKQLKEQALREGWPVQGVLTELKW